MRSHDHAAPGVGVVVRVREDGVGWLVAGVLLRQAALFATGNVLALPAVIGRRCSSTPARPRGAEFPRRFRSCGSGSLGKLGKAQ